MLGRGVFFVHFMMLIRTYYTPVSIAGGFIYPPGN